MIGRGGCCANFDVREGTDAFRGCWSEMEGLRGDGEGAGIGGDFIDAAGVTGLCAGVEGPEVEMPRPAVK